VLRAVSGERGRSWWGFLQSGTAEEEESAKTADGVNTVLLERGGARRRPCLEVVRVADISPSASSDG
jgi:hypothetical protein